MAKSSEQMIREIAEAKCAFIKNRSKRRRVIKLYSMALRLKFAGAL
jgi:hypothetical protein